MDPAGQTAPGRDASPRPEPASVAARQPAAIVALQRNAGNRATTRLVADSGWVARPRRLDRCAGACTCGGRCGKGDEELDERVTGELCRAVVARSLAPEH